MHVPHQHHAPEQPTGSRRGNGQVFRYLRCGRGPEARDVAERVRGGRSRPGGLFSAVAACRPRPPHRPIAVSLTALGADQARHLARPQRRRQHPDSMSTEYVARHASLRLHSQTESLEGMKDGRDTIRFQVDHSVIVLFLRPRTSLIDDQHRETIVKYPLDGFQPVGILQMTSRRIDLSGEDQKLRVERRLACRRWRKASELAHGSAHE
jgi:hypothetical protein